MTITLSHLEDWRLQARELEHLVDLIIIALTDEPRLASLVLRLQALKNKAGCLLEQITVEGEE